MIGASPAILIQLELAQGAKSISFEETSVVPRNTGLKQGVAQPRVKPMKKNRKTPPNYADAPLAPPTMLSKPEVVIVLRHHRRPQQHHQATPIDLRGKRTYSEVVVETFDHDRLNAISASQSCSQSERSASEPPPDIDMLSYFSGNPFVEKTQGILHFFKIKEEALAREADTRMLCMLGVPSSMCIKELVLFFSSMMDTIEIMKIVRDASPNQYNVIIKFKTHHDCVVFYEELNGQEFNSLESHRCVLLFVNKIEQVSDDSAGKNISDVLTELPTCAVCLMPRCPMLPSCPVCRYIQTPETVENQRCSDCGQATDLWICLICGNIGCGRYAEAHAYRHFEATSHTFCLQIGGERVWDYAGDNYVHRLIQANDSGKLIEYQRNSSACGEMEKDAKMDSLKMEYTVLLTSQLEAQREFYEGRLAEERRQHNAYEEQTTKQLTDMRAQIRKLQTDFKLAHDEIESLASAKNALDRKLQTAHTKIGKLQAQLEEEKSLNESALNNSRAWIAKCTETEKEKLQMAELLEEQSAQIKDLMLHLEGKEIIEAKLQNEDVSGASIGLAATPTKSSSRRRKGAKK